MNIDVIAFYSQVSSIALGFPGAEASTSYGTPAFKVSKKLFARLREDGKTLVVYTNERDKWMKANPVTFFITDHYKNYPLMLIDLVTVKKKDLKQLLYASWEIRAPKKLVKKEKLENTWKRYRIKPGKTLESGCRIVVFITGANNHKTNNRYLCNS